jgi:hypothetical protein
MNGASWREREHTLELINAEFNQRLTLHAAVASGIDTKATFVLGFAAIGLQLLLGTSRADPWDAFAFGFFGLSIVAGIACIAIREYKVVPEPAEMNLLYQRYLADGSPNLRELVLGQLVGTKEVAITKNKRRDKGKVRLWWVTVIAFGIAVAFALASVTEAPDAHAGSGTHRHSTSRAGR